jgi:hypothetical protein
LYPACVPLVYRQVPSLGPVGNPQKKIPFWSWSLPNILTLTPLTLTLSLKGRGENKGQYFSAKAILLAKAIY